MPVRHEWLSQQIAEFLAAVSSYRDETAAIDGAVERATEAVEAEVGAVVRHGSVVACVGFPQGATPVADLVAAASGRGPLHVPGLGPCPVLAVPIESGTLVLARSGGEFTREESALLRGFGRVLSLTLRMLRVLEAERDLRRESQAQAAENLRLMDVLRDQATHDPLTGLPNRTLVLDRLSQALARLSRSGAPVAVLFVDLDRFKVVNDSLGHTAGDEALVRLADRLRAAVRQPDTVGRLAGDEFVVVCEDTDARKALAVADRVARAIAAPLPLRAGETVVTASIGIAHGEPGIDAEAMLRDSDAAMYRAKERGRSRIEIFDSAMRHRMLERLETERSLRAAMQNGELRLHYQPIVCLDDGRVVAAEALLRWYHPERGMVGPAEFIPVAEESGLILPLGRWVLGQSCTQLAAWRAAGRSALRVTVNLSARQFGDPDLVGVVAGALRASGLPGEALWLEITESVLMEEAEATAETLRALKALGVHLSVDDFGTGYSSLSYLKRFPVDALKIDRSFVDGLARDPEDEAIVTAVVSLAQALNLEVVAEGVEEPAQLSKLHQLGCDAVQGYLFGPPREPEHLISHASPLVLAVAETAPLRTAVPR